jgi:dTDP-4-dehydrorhamnose 3,5-epimerase
MIFKETPLRGAYLVELEMLKDDRGFFARTFCAKEFHDHGLADVFVQCNTSWNARMGTLRGLHYQRLPSSEVKLVRCTSGALWDLIVDLRPESPTYLQSFGVELSARNRLALYIPKMFAHGFQTLEDQTEVFYQMSEPYVRELSAGLRYDDPKLGIRWPTTVSIIAEKDLTWPLLSETNSIADLALSSR